jgi:hypothetical protein
MRFCQSLSQSIRVGSCATCDMSYRCDKFIKWYKNNKPTYNNFILGHIKRFPDKYELGGFFMATKTMQGNFILIFDDNKLVNTFPKSKLPNLTQKQLTELQGKRLIEARPKELELIYKITVKQKDWNGKLKQSTGMAK